MQEIKLSVVVREGKSTKKQLSALRDEKRLPGIVYGGDKPPLHVALSEKELLAARKKGGANAILHLETGKATETVIVKELQRHPVNDRLVHADFQRISMTEKITAKVPIHVTGEAPGVKNDGGTLQYELREIAVRALPKDIPQSLTVDISKLNIGMHAEVKELSIPAGVELVAAPDLRVVSVTLVKEIVVETPAEGAVPAEGEVGAAPAEPELASTKGKKDEEGNLIKETAAPAAGEKGKPAAKGAEKGKAPAAAPAAAPAKAAPPAKK
ncbi:MAG: 50S ribosomal protein L25 [Elusimicrobia bacterium]|nr:50S ribosomal protein L25 [Elusimicrobiota bacterium]